MTRKQTLIWPDPPDDVIHVGEWPTVYVLRGIGGEVAYVGKTKNIFTRFGEHLRNPVKRSLVRTAELYRCHNMGEATELENKMIDFYQPPLNIAGKRVA